MREASMIKKLNHAGVLFTIIFVLIFASTIQAAENIQTSKAKLTFQDVFHFKSAKSKIISEDGTSLAFIAKPYRGEAQGQLYDLKNNQLITSVEHASDVLFNKQGNWAAFTVKASLLSIEKANEKERKKLKKEKSLTLVSVTDGAQYKYANIADFKISNDGKWLAYRAKGDKNKESNSKEDKSSKIEENSDIKADKKDKVYPLTLVNLTDFTHSEIPSVLHYSFSASNQKLAYSNTTDKQQNNQISVKDLDNLSATPAVIANKAGLHTSTLVWHPKKDILAIASGNYQNTDLRRRSYTIELWHDKAKQLSKLANPYKNWFTDKTAKLFWSEHGERLYFQNSPAIVNKSKTLKVSNNKDLYDYATIRQETELSVWHPKDNYTKPREKVLWKKENKHKHYQAVYHLSAKKSVQLTNPELAKTNVHTERVHLLARDPSPYFHSENYLGSYSDFYAIDIHTGEKTLIQKNALSYNRPSLSPDGKYAVYLLNNTLVLKNLASGKTTPLTVNNQHIFSDEQHDYPSPNEGYGYAGWMSDSQSVLVYSKHDIWSFNVDSFKATQLTHGAKLNISYRVKHFDKKKVGFNSQDKLYLTAHNLSNKETELAQLDLANKTITPLASGQAKFSYIAKAKSAETILFSKEDYHTYPDIWVSQDNFAKTSKVTNLNPQVDQFSWGQTPELIRYKGYNGEDLQGTLIKPAGYQAGDKVPVIIYFYRYMSQRRYDFPKMVLNHRPNFPMFTSNGYAVFLPDIRFEIGKPGPSSTQTMINAAQKLIDLGIAHPDKIGLQGHSWAGYQSAFMITQTDMFKAVVSGAPVSNMTSAYGGIRLKSGKTRQFQYESGQSRIGKSLFEARDLYIENSPLFFADKVNTPILIMFGDKDDAVPWHEGVQYYLALKREGKDSIFLQYEGEPHHLKKFANQVDFSIRMKEYFDHYLMGKPKAKWMQEGEPYINEED